MEIIKEEINKFKYSFIYAFDSNVLEFCRLLKNEYGNQNFNFSKGSWRFSDLSFVERIQDRYLDVVISDEVKEDLELFELEQKKEEIRLRKNEKLKEATDSNIKVKGIKGELYDYQRAAVSWLANNQGRGLLSLDLGLGKTFVSLAYTVHTKKRKTLFKVS